MKRRFGREDWFWIGCALLAGLLLAIQGQAMAANHRDNPGDCDRMETSGYVSQPGDLSDASELDVSRAFSGKGSLQLNVCAGQLRILPSRQPGELRIHVSIPASAEKGGSLKDFVRKLDVSDDNAQIDIRTPGSEHATVIVELPTSPELRTEVNLGSGDMQIKADGLGGMKKLNLGAGHMELDCDGDRDYASMEVNVGLGSLKDMRPGGHHSFGVTSKNYTGSGSGSGSIEANVGAGHIEIREPD